MLVDGGGNLRDHQSKFCISSYLIADETSSSLKDSLAKNQASMRQLRHRLIHFATTLERRAANHKQSNKFDKDHEAVQKNRNK